jgi:hypothetical protein
MVSGQNVMDGIVRQHAEKLKTLKQNEQDDGMVVRSYKFEIESSNHEGTKQKIMILPIF